MDHTWRVSPFAPFTGGLAGTAPATGAPRPIRRQRSPCRCSSVLTFTCTDRALWRDLPARIEVLIDGAGHCRSRNEVTAAPLEFLTVELR